MLERTSLGLAITTFAVTSATVDTYGDWHYLTRFGRALVRPRELRGMLRGTDSTFVDEYFFDYNA